MIQSVTNISTINGSGLSPEIQVKSSDNKQLSLTTEQDFSDYPFPVIRDHKKSIEDVLEIDKKGQDSHVPRDPRLLRLTGAHPFNCESPLTLLYNSGFLTPSALHFVRNHGAVPQVQEEEIMQWKITIEGMVENPITVDLKSIMTEFQQYTVPVTLCCAGNRRKEQNMVKKGSGFNWGAAGISNSLWTGPFLKDVIAKAKPSRKARYVWMEGADSPANGAYGTCIKLPWVNDPERCIMLAYRQNGELLEPDHGKPLRVVIPGVIGGRSVKWLKRLVISDQPSNNWYHFYDNRVLPTYLSPEVAKLEDKWWKDERYALYNLNVQSVTVYPENQEVIQSSSSQEFYPVRGFAYNGGGVRIGRVEISLDRGVTWKLTEIDYPEDRYRNAEPFELFGGLVNVCDRMSYLCWCFWTIKVPVSELFNAKDIVVRAMDDNMSTQPRDMYWNVTSMLNNWWYRVAIVHEDDSIRFEHPVIANKSGGWMDRVKSQGGNILSRNWGENEQDDEGDNEANKGPTQAELDFLMMTDPSKLSTIITRLELLAHSTELDPWFVVNGQVFDGKPYLEDHPGGAQSITLVAGEDATDDFMAVHSDHAKKLLAKFHLGVLEKNSDEAESSSSSQEANVPTATFLNPKKWKKLKLVNKKVISPDSRIFSFELEHPDQTSGLPVGQHLYLRVKDKDGYVMRAYTPKSNHLQKGVVDILIKVYFPKGDIPGGRLTSILENFKIGDSLEIKGPIGEFEYLGDGSFIAHGHERNIKSYLMIGGGSGLTPPYQVFMEMSRLREEHINVDFYFGNRTEQDILLKEELDQVFEELPNFNIHYLLSQPSESWKGITGRVDSALLDKYVERRGGKVDDFMVLICGPKPMEEGVIKWASETGVPENNIHRF